ncbi:MAG TPA: PH domain-containing protein [Phycisphaerales bacterium]|nr:PH domain-containing protein [Phycisphaerales bacterium]
MIRKRCDNCEKIIEVEDTYAGQKVACGACGDINVMPAAPVAPIPTARVQDDRAARLGLPPDGGPEQGVLKVRPAMARARPLVFLAHLLVFAAGGVGVWWGLQGAEDGGRTAALIGGAVLGLIVLVSLAVWKIKTMSAALEITNKRTVMRRGLLSKATSEVVHDNIRNVQVTQSFWQRVWRVGELGLSSSGQDGIEIQIGDIPDPERVREVIDAYRPLG